MKRITALLICIALLFTITSCGNDAESGNKNANQPPTVSDVLEAGMSEEEKSERQSGVDEGAPVPEDIDEAAVAASASEGIDVDLTALSSTMVYSEVYNMMSQPENYIGKTIRIDGMFSIFHDDATNIDYYGCINMDATACCSQGLEFVPTDDYTYPDDFPEEGGYICVTGVFDTYEDGEYMYCTLRNASIR